jgi:hypothetical protein
MRGLGRRGPRSPCSGAQRNGYRPGQGTIGPLQVGARPLVLPLPRLLKYTSVRQVKFHRWLRQSPLTADRLLDLLLLHLLASPAT